MSKILNEQELTERLNNLLASANYRGILKLIQSQKKAHADMIIGKDMPEDVTSGGDYLYHVHRNGLRAEQRERNK